MHLSGYRYMWVMVMFDLPVETRIARRDYARFRKRLLKDGFLMLQYSIYARHCPSEENAQVHIQRIEFGIPPNGEVRILTVTEKQYERMRIFCGKRPKPPERGLRQLEFF